MLPSNPFPVGHPAAGQSSVYWVLGQGRDSGKIGTITGTHSIRISQRLGDVDEGSDHSQENKQVKSKTI